MDYSSLPIRIFLNPWEDLMKLAVQHPEGYDTDLKMVRYISNQSSLTIPGVLISTWKVDIQIQNQFNVQDARHIQDRFGSFFGSRPSVKSRGINGYLGSRFSSMSNITPTHGPSTLFKASYFRSSYDKDHLHYHLQGKLHNSAQRIIQLSKKFNNYYISFVGDKTCKRLIVTSGSKERSSRQLTQNGHLVQRKEALAGKYIGFFNTYHIDSSDIVTSSTIWKKYYQKIDRYSNTLGYNKIMDIYKNLNFGLPTTCGYNKLSVTGNEKKIEGWFIVGPLALPIENGAVHHFLGWTFPHCTTVPYLRRDGKIYTLNTKDEETYIFAWGSSGGRAHAEAAVDASTTKDIKNEEQKEEFHKNRSKKRMFSTDVAGRTRSSGTVISPNNKGMNVLEVETANINSEKKN